jgi:two-component system response regulator HupR/HoxA
MGPFDDKVPRHPLNRGPVVLCVDDDPGVLNALRRSLSRERCDVITAGGPDEALAWLNEVPVHLVIADQRMPDMTGTELLNQVRKRSPQTARALLTGHRTPSVVRLGLEAGADAFFFKPWDERYLIDTVRRILGLGDETEESI